MKKLVSLFVAAGMLFFSCGNKNVQEEVEEIDTTVVEEAVIDTVVEEVAEPAPVKATTTVKKNVVKTAKADVSNAKKAEVKTTNTSTASLKKEEKATAVSTNETKKVEVNTTNVSTATLRPVSVSNNTENSSEPATATPTSGKKAF